MICKRNLILAAALTCVTALPAQAASRAAVGNEAAARSGAATKYCIHVSATSSRIARKTCLTKEGWKARGVDVEAEISRSR